MNKGTVTYGNVAGCVGGRRFLAVALGGDMNCYGVARTFYEAYGIRTVMIGRMPVFPTAHSNLVERYYEPNLLQDKPLLRILSWIEEKYPDTAKFVFGTNDDYVRHIIHNKAAIEALGDFIVPTIGEELFDRLDDKNSFYEVCEEYGLPYPKSVVFDCAADNVEAFELPFDYPIFIKPVSNVVYFNFEFEGKQKGYRLDSKEELREVIGRIQGAGYPGKFVFQEYIEGDDDSMYIYSAYCDRSGRVRVMSGGHILMHDRTPELIGNYNAVGSARDDSLTDRLRDFLEKIGFTGICHFDVQYDAKRGDYVVYEINIRQGRSNYYMTASGMNYAELLAEDYFGDLSGHINRLEAFGEVSYPESAPGASAGAGDFDPDHEGAASPETSYVVADKPFIVSNVSRINLMNAIGRSKVTAVPKSSFYWFQLAPYDRSPKNLTYMFRLQRSIMRNYYKYNY